MRIIHIFAHNGGKDTNTSSNEEQSMQEIIA